MTRVASVGFDRRVRSEWLDAIASKQAGGTTMAALRTFGHELLRDGYPGEDARRKTLTVLLHLWVDVPERAVTLRDAALKLLPEFDSHHRVALHWGLALATYPFFRDIADAAGRLLALQGSVSLAQLQRRLAERWGQRSTTERAAQRIVRSWIDWGVLSETHERGTYTTRRRISLSGALASWIVEAVLVAGEADAQVVAKIRNAALLFPFDVRIASHELRRAAGLIVHREGVDEDVVTLKVREPVKSAAKRRQMRLW